MLKELSFAVVTNIREIFPSFSSILPASSAFSSPDLNSSHNETASLETADFLQIIQLFRAFKRVLKRVSIRKQNSDGNKRSRWDFKTLLAAMLIGTCVLALREHSLVQRHFSVIVNLCGTFWKRNLQMFMYVMHVKYSIGVVGEERRGGEGDVRERKKRWSTTSSERP